ncbi:MAG: alpha/beta hydrolase family protein, partial [bacterium]
MEKLEELLVLAGIPKYSDHKEMLFKHLMRLPGSLFLDRMVALAQVQTPSDWLMRKTYLLAKYKEILGEFPSKTPLNPQITGVIEKDDYIIEKVIFESRPEFYVTANLYLPKSPLTPLCQRGEGGGFPAPAVVCPLGHWEKSKAGPEVQARLIGLAKKGYVALAYDPIGQGERLQYYDIILGKSAVGGPVNEHTVAGNQCFLTGATLAQYHIWDGIRAVDYLCSRTEVDSENIACTGASGGGTLTMYLVPLEERIKVSVPVAAIGTLQRSWESGGISDAEQNLPKSVLYGIDHGDLLSLVAPRPLMIIRECKDYIRL